jgi:hypothetical protein
VETGHFASCTEERGLRRSGAYFRDKPWAHACRAMEMKVPDGCITFNDIRVDDSKFYWKSFLTLDSTPKVIVLAMSSKKPNN